MRRLISTSRFRFALVFTLVVGIALVSTCRQFRIWSRHDYHVYETLRKDYPIGLDLWYGRITAGQSIEEPKLRPVHGTVRNSGRFTSLVFYPGPPSSPGLPFEGITLVARDGRLVCAGMYSCTWRKVFFDVTTAEDRAEFQREYDEWFKREFP